MCFMKKQEVKQRDPIAPPEKIADPTDVGAVRKREDEELFGGVPDMRVDRSAIPDAVAGGGGLREVM